MAIPPERRWRMPSKKDIIDAVYRRGNLLDKRRRLMDAWGAYWEGKRSQSEG